MPYVMVPVPEEHVQEAMEAVLRITRQGRLTPWDQTSIDAFFRAADEPSKALLSLIARATLAGRQLSQAGVADALELSQRDIVGMMREINDGARDEGRPAVLAHQEITETLPNGRTRMVAVITTTVEYAQFIQDAEKAELAEGSDPLGGLPG
jgi:hypothetical protein